MKSLLVSGSKNDRQPKPRSQARLQAKKADQVPAAKPLHQPHPGSQPVLRWWTKGLPKLSCLREGSFGKAEVQGLGFPKSLASMNVAGVSPDMGSQRL